MTIAVMPISGLKMREMKTRDEDLIFKSESYTIVGACFAVFRDQGCALLEASFPVFSGLSR